jgi:hypothetical protein
VKQINWFVGRIGPAVGARKAPDARACEASREDVGQARMGSTVGPGVRGPCSGVEQTLLLVPLLCALLSPTYNTAAGQDAERASRGRGAKGDTVFVVQADAELACAWGHCGRILNSHCRTWACEGSRAWGKCAVDAGSGVT